MIKTFIFLHIGLGFIFNKSNAYVYKKERLNCLCPAKKNIPPYGQKYWKQFLNFFKIKFYNDKPNNINPNNMIILFFDNYNVTIKYSSGVSLLHVAMRAKEYFLTIYPSAKITLKNNKIFGDGFIATFTYID